jgi:hypothetical protein
MWGDIACDMQCDHTFSKSNPTLFVVIMQETGYTQVLRLNIQFLGKLDFTTKFYTFLNVGNKFKISKNDQN